MYGQLTAIAREFNFPSTAGLCLYLHVSESGITVTPRISDESWQLLWGHLLDGVTPASSSHGFPIGGRIEFDVDLRKARWYTSWIAASRRDTVMGSHPPSLSHWRGESKTSFADEQAAEEQEENPLINTPMSTLRQIPRKLSLVDRFEFSTQSASRPASQSGVVTLGSLEAQIVPALSPIIQTDEPQTAKQNLEKRVKSWRASSLAPTPLASTGEFALEVADIPSGVYVDEHSTGLAEELNLDDFSWSVSSAGPPSDGTSSPLSSYRLPSVHIDRRMEGSVCPTPSVCTSFGPFDYDQV